MSIGYGYGNSLSVTGEMKGASTNLQKTIPFTTSASGTRFSDAQMNVLYDGAQMTAGAGDGQVGGLYMGYTSNGTVGGANGFISARRADGSRGTQNGPEEVLQLNPGGGSVRVNGKVVASQFVWNDGDTQLNIGTKLKELLGGAITTSPTPPTTDLEARIALLEARLDALTSH